MRALPFSELSNDPRPFDREVERTPGIDRFCTASDWILPAASELMPERAPFTYQSENGWITLMQGRHFEGQRYLEPFEAAWGLASPVVGSAAIVGDLAGLLREHAPGWDVLLVTGLAADSSLFRAVVELLGPRYRLLPGQLTVRHVAAVHDGVDGFLSRRSANLRRSLRRAARRARAAGIEFEYHTSGPPRELYARVVAVERRSWKGRQGFGIDRGDMREFYARMIERLASRDAHRVLFARLDGRDVGYMLGGVRGGTYRGLQFSFDHDLAGLSLGNLLQLEQVTRLTDEAITHYDLGTAVRYKERWAESRFDTVSCFVVRH